MPAQGPPVPTHERGYRNWATRCQAKRCKAKASPPGAQTRLVGEPCRARTSHPAAAAPGAAFRRDRFPLDTRRCPAASSKRSRPHGAWGRLADSGRLGGFLKDGKIPVVFYRLSIGLPICGSWICQTPRLRFQHQRSQMRPRAPSHRTGLTLHLQPAPTLCREPPVLKRPPGS